MSNAPSASARQRRKSARPQELLDAALALFVEKGFAATRSDEVARRAGVAKGTLYLYYPSKAELFKAVVRRNLSNLIAEGEAVAIAHAGSSAELLASLIGSWWHRFGDKAAAGIQRVLMAEVPHFPELAQFYLDEVIGPAGRLFAGAIERGVASGEFRSVPVLETAYALIAPVVFLATHRETFGECGSHSALAVEPAAMLQAQIDLALRGLLVRSVAP